MLTNGILAQKSMQSPLAGQSALKPKGWKMARPMLFSLALTSLIDAFAILTIFLLTSNSDPAQSLNMEGVRLPTVTEADAMELGTVVKVSQGRYYVDGVETQPSQLVAALVKIRQKEQDPKLIIQADRQEDYQALNPVILAGSQAGFQKYKFAVHPERTKL